MAANVLELLARATHAAIGARLRDPSASALPDVFPATTLAFARAIAKLAPPPPRDDRAVVVLVHGILGGHLRRGETRVWLDLPRLAGEGAGDLALSPAEWDGIYAHSEVEPAHVALEPAYGLATWVWRQRGLVVEELGYDWRRDIRDEARRLAASLGTLRARHGARPMFLVAHSLGGLVASLAARVDPPLFEGLAKVGFVGSPLAGSFAPISLLCGDEPLAAFIGIASKGDSHASIRRTAASWPSMIQMFPRADRYDVAPFAPADRWPDGAPAARLLELRDAFQSAVLASPLLPRATRFVTSCFPTACDPTWTGTRWSWTRRAGDGTVPESSQLFGAGPATEIVQAAGYHPVSVQDPIVLRHVLAWAGDPLAALFTPGELAHVTGLFGDEKSGTLTTPPRDPVPIDPDTPATAEDERILGIPG